MDSRSQTASSNFNALETLRDTLLLSEGFWARECRGSLIRDITRTLLCRGSHFLPGHARHYFTHKHAHTLQYRRKHVHTHTHTHTHTHIDNTSQQPTHKLLSPQRIQSHREIWPYRPNWIAVIPCLTCFGDV